MLKYSFLIILLSISFTGFTQGISELTAEGNLEEVKKLVKADKSLVNKKDNEGDIPLCTSILRQYSSLSLFFIENGADLNNQNMDGYTPLHWAAVRGDAKIAQALINSGAEIDIKDKEGETPLHIAGTRRKIDFAKCLLKNGAALEIDNNYKRTPLIVAARETGGIEMIKALVEGGANVNATDFFGDTPLGLAAWRGFEDIVDYLLNKGAQISTDEKVSIKLMTYAADKRLEQLYQELIRKGGDAFLSQLKNQPALHWAAAGGSVEIVGDLLKRSFKINETDAYHWAPLHYAAYSGRLKAAKLLLDQGADINALTPLGETPLYLAGLEGKNNVMDLLIGNGANQEVPGSTNIAGEYMGQKKPGKVPELFAPGIISRLKGGHSNITFSPDGKEAFWTEWILADVGYSQGCTVWHSKIENGLWTMPEKFLSNGDTPFFSADGQKIFLLATFPLPPENQNLKGIWYYEKDKSSFTGPKHLDFDVNGTGLYWQFSLDKNENIYFSSEGLCRSKNSTGKYLEKEKLSDIFNPDYQGGAPYISPDEDYIIFSSRLLPGSFGSMDLYIGFKKSDGTWTDPINMGPSVNSASQEHLSLVTSDGKYLFLRTERNGVHGVYWLDAGIIEELKSKTLR